MTPRKTVISSSVIVAMLTGFAAAGAPTTRTAAPPTQPAEQKIMVFSHWFEVESDSAEPDFFGKRGRTLSGREVDSPVSADEEVATLIHPETNPLGLGLAIVDRNMALDFTRFEVPLTDGLPGKPKAKGLFKSKPSFELISRPSILVLPGQEAQVVIGSSLPILQQDENGKVIGNKPRTECGADNRSEEGVSMRVLISEATPEAILFETLELERSYIQFRRPLKPSSFCSSINVRNTFRSEMSFPLASGKAAVIRWPAPEGDAGLYVILSAKFVGPDSELTDQPSAKSPSDADEAAAKSQESGQ